MTDVKMNNLIKQLIIMALTRELKRKPTEDEIFEEFQITFHDMLQMSIEERLANAFPEVPEDESLDLPPSKSDMENLGYWSEDKYE
jgi:hypothetical protein